MPTQLSDIDNLLMSLNLPLKTEGATQPDGAAPTDLKTPETRVAESEVPLMKVAEAAAVTPREKAERPRVAQLPRISNASASANLPPKGNSPRPTRGSHHFLPKSPDSLEQAGLLINDVMNLIIKYLASRGVETGFNVSMQMGLKFPLVESILRQLKVERLAAYKNSIAGGDYLYELTDLGRERARILSQHTTYFGTAPVPLDQYIASVNAQSLEGRKPSLNSIRKAFSDLDISEHMLSNIGQAIHSGRGMFLYGAAGNGKTSMAERVTKSFGDCIWIPRSIFASGEILRLYDPNRHKEVPVDEELEHEIDGRWIQIERPTIVAGGELRMDNLEITYIRDSGIGEAPLQMKANCGTLLIDDFGRQRMSTDELLNRWIVPLEQRHDFLHLESGRTIQVPFDQLIIFSSNLEPRDLVDDAFLRRIPYKIEVKDPTEDEYRSLLIRMIQKARFECTAEVIDYLVQEHYIAAQRPFRFCHPRDLIRQMENRCTLHSLPREVTREAVDQAMENYFSIM